MVIFHGDLLDYWRVVSIWNIFETRYGIRPIVLTIPGGAPGKEGGVDANFLGDTFFGTPKVL